MEILIQQTILIFMLIIVGFGIYVCIKIVVNELRQDSWPIDYETTIISSIGGLMLTVIFAIFSYLLYLTFL